MRHLTESEKITKKRALFERGGFVTILDSLTGQEIIPEMQMIDLGLFMPKIRISMAERIEQGMIDRLRSGHKITLAGGF